MASTDFDFVNNIVRHLGQRAEAQGLENLSPAEQTVLLAWWAYGIIDNGGFRYFYEGATNSEQVASAFETLDVPTAAHACRETLAVFPSSVLAGGCASCQQWLNAHYTEEELSNLFAKQDAVLWEMDGRLEAILANYIREHRTEFEVPF